MSTKRVFAVLFVAVVMIGMPVKAHAQGVIWGLIGRNGTQFSIDSVGFKYMNGTYLVKPSVGWGADQDTWSFNVMEWPDYYMKMFCRNDTAHLAPLFYFYPADAKVETVHVSHTASATVMFRDYTVGVEEENRNPSGLILSGALPNPFHSSTTISFASPAPGNVDLAIYDATGTQVRTLVSGRVASGNHSLVWTGTNDFGRALESGIYFCHLSTQGQTLTEKLILEP